MTTNRPSHSILIRPEHARRFVSSALRACDVPSQDAELISESMIEADLTGADAHGIARLPQYVDALRKRHINARPHMQL